MYESVDEIPLYPPTMGEQRRLLLRTYELATKSPDPSTQNGALLIDPFDPNIVLAEGWNDFPRKVHQESDRWKRPQKYQYVEHAERSVIYKAASQGISTKRLTLVCPWAACADCARAIICSGISSLITHQESYDKSSDHWKDSIAAAFEMFKEAEIRVFWYTGKIQGPAVLRDGSSWAP